MTFATPLLLLLLLLIPLFVWGALLRQKRCSRRLLHLSRHAQATSARLPLQLSLVALAFACLVIALAGPRWGRSAEEVFVRSRTLMLAVDVSRSMLAEDIYPSRLERAKADLVDLLDVCRGDRVGLLAFRGRANLLCPLTTDEAYLRSTIDALSIQSAPPGETNLADAIRRSLDAFEEEATSHCAILLITDGEDLDGDALALAKEAGERKIPIFTVGIGSEAGATIPEDNGVVTYEGEPVISRLKPETLRAIAEASGGQYIPLATAERARTTLRAVYTRYLSQLADKETREQIEHRLTDRTALFVFCAVLLLMVAGATSQGRLSRKRHKVTTTLLFLLCVATAHANATPRDAQRAYDAGNFADAARMYGELRTSTDPARIPLYAYNGALAHWKAGDAEAALTALLPALEDDTFALRANALAGLLRMELDGKEPDLAKRIALRTAAIENFTEVLRQAPSDEARRNLARARDGLDTLRFALRKETALERYKEKSLGQLIPEMLAQQRALLPRAQETFTQAKPRLRLAQFETLSRDVTEQADKWFAVQAALPEALAQIEDEQVRNELLALSENEQQRLDDAATAYLLHHAEAKPLEEGEPPLYRLWQMMAEPPALIDESITVQTHEVKQGSQLRPDRTNLNDVYTLLSLFKHRFPEWAQAQLQAAAQQPPTEGEDAQPPAFTEEDIRIINEATDATLALLTSADATQNKAAILGNLELIREHLPRNSNSSQSQDKNPSASPQSQPQQEESEPQEGEGNNAPQPQPQEQEAQQQEQEAQPQEAEPSDEEKELEALLQRAVDREREHNEEKQRYLRPRRPTARDW